MIDAALRVIGVIVLRLPGNGLLHRFLQFLEKRLNAMRAHLFQPLQAMLQGLDGGRRGVALKLLGNERARDFRRYRRMLARQHEEQGGGKGINVGLGGELGDAHILLYRCIALTDAHHLDARRGAPLFVVVLGKAEVDEHWTHVLVEHDVVGLHVEVRHAVLVKEAQRMAHLVGNPQRLLLGKHAAVAPSHIGAQLLAVNELHDVVSGAVGLKHLVHPHDVIMAAQGVQPARLAEEGLQAVLHIGNVVRVRDDD